MAGRRGNTKRQSNGNPLLRLKGQAESPFERVHLTPKNSLLLTQQQKRLIEERETLVVAATKNPLKVLSDPEQRRRFDYLVERDARKKIICGYLRAQLNQHMPNRRNAKNAEARIREVENALNVLTEHELIELLWEAKRIRNKVLHPNGHLERAILEKAAQPDLFNPEAKK